MKRILLLSLLCISGTLAMAQTTWTGAGADNNWGNASNWNTNMVPTATDDVVIPTESTVTLNVTGNVRSINIQGNSLFEMNSSLNFLENSSFGANNLVYWNAGALNGNGAVLTSNGAIDIDAGNVTLGIGTTLTNTGQINFFGGGDIFISTDAVLNNATIGIINFRGADSGFTASGGAPRVLNNEGLIKTTFVDNTSQSSIGADLKNNGGTIQVEKGTLNLTSSLTELTDGVYNVFSGATLEWDSIVLLEGTLTGLINGEYNWRSTANVLTSATLDFTGNGTINWVAGALAGGGILTNESNIEIQNGNVTLGIDTTLNNNGFINFVGSGDIFITTNAVLNNTPSGIIDLQGADSGFTASGGAPRVLNNEGLIKTTFVDNTSQSSIGADLRNNGGTIRVEKGTLNLTSSLTELTDGVYNVFSGASLEWDSIVLLEGTLTGLINGEYNWRSTANVLTSATLDFTGNGTINWVAGALAGGGILTNESNIEIQNGNVTLGIDTTLNNNGFINFVGSGDIFISTNAVFNNTSSGTIDFESADSGFTASGGAPRVLNNQGLIKTTFTDNSSQSTIGADLRNNGGTIQVENGTLNLASSLTELNGGTYNIFANGTLDWDAPMTLTGELTGVVDGIINWRSSLTVPETETATLNFSGNQTLSWVSGTLSSDSKLTNNSTIEILNGSVTMAGNTIFNNNGSFNFNSGGDLFVTTNAVFNNLATGEIKFVGNGSAFVQSGGAPQTLNNSGVIIRTVGGTNSGANFSNIGIAVINTGVIIADEGNLNFNNLLDNQVDGIITGNANFGPPSVSFFTNNGTFAPGGSPGSLNVNGSYKSTSLSVLDIELFGLVPVSEYDVLNIDFTPLIFEGSVAVTMGFEGTIGDTFTIANTTSLIDVANLQSPIENVDFDGKRYTFEVSYPDNNKVVLTITGKLDIQDPNTIAQDVTVELDASGTASVLPSEIDNGSTDNCSLPANLIYALDTSSFDCSNLGANTVTLTVTDEAGNSASQTATVTVVDSISPVVTCGNDISIDSNGNFVLPNYMTNGTASASDNCSATLVQTPAAGTSLADGTYTISFVATDGSGNTGTCSFTLTVNDTLGVDEFGLSSASIELYPNPVSNLLTIKNVNNLELNSASITDITGKVITTFDLKNMGLSTEISLQNLSNGMYFVKINGLNSSVTKQVIKQ